MPELFQCHKNIMNDRMLGCGLIVNKMTFTVFNSIVSDDVVLAITNSGTVKVWTMTGNEGKVKCTF